MFPLKPQYDEETGEYVLGRLGVGVFYGATPDECYAAYFETLRVRASHARKNPQESEHAHQGTD